MSCGLTSPAQRSRSRSRSMPSVGVASVGGERGLMAGGAQRPPGTRRSRPMRESDDRRRRAGARAGRRSAASKQRSDLSARAITAIPAIAVALFLVIEGGLIFTLGVLVLGAVCMHEFYG